MGLLLLALGLVAGEPAAGTELAVGLRWTEDRMDDAAVHILRVRPGAATWRVLRAPAPRTAWRVEDLPEGERPLVAVNGGYFDVDGAAMGLLVQDGRELNPLRRADWGVFWIDREGRGHLHHRRDFAWPKWQKKVDFAVQCGPRVRVRGKPVELRPGAARRTLVGIRGDGDLVLAVFPSRVELRDAGRWLHERWDVRDLLNLDGGSSTQLALSQGGTWRTLAPGVSVPVLIGLFPRAGGAAPDVPR
ncbi:MAG: phosphodiester glycosidase family protein [Deltaproteobacteria bacterium]|nr:phosphodiester glycosidase family protein [Deltaproteobacteria bacterium]